MTNAEILATATRMHALTGLSFFFLIIAFMLALSAKKYHQIGDKFMRNWAIASTIACIGMIFYLWFGYDFVG